MSCSIKKGHLSTLSSAASESFPPGQHLSLTLSFRPQSLIPLLMARHDFIHMASQARRGTGHQPGHSPSSTQHSNSSQSQSQTPHSRTRSPSPAPELAVNNMTGTQIGRNIETIKEFISQHFLSSSDADSTQQAKKRR